MERCQDIRIRKPVPTTAEYNRRGRVLSPEETDSELLGAFTPRRRQQAVYKNNLSISHVTHHYHPLIMIEIYDLRIARQHSALGVSAEPQIAWRYRATVKGPAGWTQTAYDIEIQRPSGSGETKVFRVASSTSLSESWPDQPLVSRETAALRVRAHGRTERAGGPESAASTPWSHWISIEAGLLAREDWTASFITSALSPAPDPCDKGLRPIRLRKTFRLSSRVPLARARLYITALGLYVAYLNGRRVGGDHMTPGYTSYHHRIQYQVYDVADLLVSGENTLGIEVAEGWYAGEIAWDNRTRCLYGSEIGALAQLEVLEEDGIAPSLLLQSDETWESQLSPILASGIWNGELYDRRLEESDWNRPRSEVSRWQQVKRMPFPSAELVVTSAPAVKVTQTVRPVKVFRTRSGKSVVDFGQNLVGRVQIHGLKRPLGHRVQIRHAEALEDGELAVRPLRGARATDTLIFGQDDTVRDWSVSFTYHGFRYAEFQGWHTQDAADPLTIDSVSALVMHTDMDRTGYFGCSDDLLNRFHENVVWSMRGNFFSIPTDCPQRDERMGWTGDIQIFSPTAAFLYDCDGMLGNWMIDLIQDQRDSNGVVPFVVPNCLSEWKWPALAQAIWDDVVILLPWVLYQYFGDVETLRESYSGMKIYLDSAIPRGEDGLWDPDIWQLGNWLDPNAPPQEPGLSRTDGTLVADEYLVYVTGIMARVAGILGNPDDCARYGADFQSLMRAFQEKYMSPSGLLVGDSQTSIALALNFNLHDTPQLQDKRSQAQDALRRRGNAADRLVRLVQYAKFRVSTGFAGTPAILHALSSSGNLQIAYRMLLEEGCPSWLYAVKMGATTVWERWDSMLPDGSVNPGAMTSFNHYALGAVADWLHTVVGGLRPVADEPGWRRFIVQPRPGGTLTNAFVELKSPCGLIRCEWRIEDGPDQIFQMDLTVPPNSTALVVLPQGNRVQNVGSEASDAKLVGSGSYHFECIYTSEGPWPPTARLTEFREDC
ncbi:alfa-L-rhamnosidase [Aspergillus steynii IBT 23096]|uniref:alpha-L-rhamnosidase n=1 Tax=Aspergillus steynii IBT 23096 TaxID=1392250 RepID=A0A2I2FWQ6_9EURO|nr:alfa-L-rhamnosidase [Aspergillus steynii IBT 23096]PLB45055.1 alfa-L-rhamnosidase [Aspergillus steynii IBT 23096]